jgi:hypothetical protein
VSSSDETYINFIAAAKALTISEAKEMWPDATIITISKDIVSILGRS